MRSTFLAAALLFLVPAAPATAAVSVSIGINVPSYPRLVAVPGYPVYYAPSLNSNYFFYDGMYWDYYNDNWYYSRWYNGPWSTVDPFDVPVYLLRVPVRYYHRPPVYFHGWARDAAPRWNEHWGHAWAERRGDWAHGHQDKVTRAPLPTYQKNYGGNRYPTAERQGEIHSQNYRYQPHEQVVQQHYRDQPQPHAQRGNDRPDSHGGGEGHGKGHDRQ